MISVLLHTCLVTDKRECLSYLLQVGLSSCVNCLVKFYCVVYISLIDLYGLFIYCSLLPMRNLNFYVVKSVL